MKLTSWNWCIPILDDFMGSLTQEKAKIVKMGKIKSSKDQAIAVGFLNPFKGKNKDKDLKQQDKKKK